MLGHTPLLPLSLAFVCTYVRIDYSINSALPLYSHAQDIMCTLIFASEDLRAGDTAQTHVWTLKYRQTRVQTLKCKHTYSANTRTDTKVQTHVQTLKCKHTYRHSNANTRTDNEAQTHVQCKRTYRHCRKLAGLRRYEYDSGCSRRKKPEDVRTLRQQSGLWPLDRATKNRLSHCGRWIWQRRKHYHTQSAHAG